MSEGVESLEDEDEAAGRVGRGFGKRSVQRVSHISLFLNLLIFIILYKISGCAHGTGTGWIGQLKSFSPL